MKTDNKYKINLDQWKRKPHYEFFKTFQQPFFGVTANVNVTEVFHYCKSYKVSFFLYYLHKSLCAVNRVEAFKLRMENDEVTSYSSISGSVTVRRLDETFGFAYFPFSKDFGEFSHDTKAAIDEEKVAKRLELRSEAGIIHFSVLTGIVFTSVQHAQSLCAQDSVPKIVFGKVYQEGSRVMMPISIHVHHALCDGGDVTSFLEIYQEKMKISG
jgi:chloramphenicol O-acetyltransferase type A